MSSNKIWLIAVFAMFLTIIGIFYYKNEQLIGEQTKQYDVLSKNIVSNNLSINQIKDKILLKFENLKIIEKEKLIIEKQSKENRNEIINTNSVDTLIALYYKYRTADSTFGQQPYCNNKKRVQAYRTASAIIK